MAIANCHHTKMALMHLRVILLEIRLDSTDLQIHLSSWAYSVQKLRSVVQWHTQRSTAFRPCNVMCWSISSSLLRIHYTRSAGRHISIYSATNIIITRRLWCCSRVPVKILHTLWAILDRTLMYSISVRISGLHVRLIKCGFNKHICNNAGANPGAPTIQLLILCPKPFPYICVWLEKFTAYVWYVSILRMLCTF